MTNAEIETKLVDLIKDERRITNEILVLINAAEERDLPRERGFPSTFEWLTRGLGYSNAAAYRRLQAAKLIRTLPEVQDKLATGELNLTTVAQAQGAIKAQEKISGEKMAAAAQAAIVTAIENQTSAEAERTLLELLPETAKVVNQERTTRLTAEQSRLTLNFSEEDLKNLAWARDYLSHAMPNAANGELLSRVLKEFVDRHSASAAEAKRTKAQHKACEYKDETTGQVCGSTYQVEEDHIVPLALGGPDTPENKRCLCRGHNLFVARQWLGKGWANAWRRKRRASA